VEVVFAKEQRILVSDEVNFQWLLNTNMTTAERAEESAKRLIEGDRPSRAQQILQEEKDCYDKWIAEYHTMVARGRVRNGCWQSSGGLSACRRLVKNSRK
jgi:hypothetical protein